jgi:hypothetical protein
MYSLGKIKNKQVILLCSFVLLIGIGVLDYITAAELTLSIFYLIPVSAHALYKDTSKKDIIVNTVFAALVWTAVIFKNYYSNSFYIYWNAFVIFLFFLIVGLLLHSLKIRYKKINEMTDRLIAFIKWNGAPFESKKKKVIKEISLIRQYCFESICLRETQAETDKVAARPAMEHMGEAHCQGEASKIT